MKKIVSLCMVVLMTFAFMSWSAFAEESEVVTEDAEIEKTEEDIETLAGSNVLESAENNIVISSGKCGENLTWSLDSEGMLKIVGSGKMEDYGYDGPYPPWRGKSSEIVYVSIGNGVTTVGAYAFYKLSNLVNVDISSGVEDIGIDAFRDCISLESIIIPQTVKNIGGFDGCRNLKRINIPNGVTYLQSSAFSGCSSITSITVPDSVTEIGNCAFYNCRSLKNIKLSNNLTAIGSSLFEGCTNLESVSIPNTVTDISFAFCNCENLKTVTIPDSVTRIDNNAFDNCCSELKIICGSNSTAEIFAREHGLRYDLTTGHQIGEGIIKKKASCSEEGQIQYKCTTCRETAKTEIIPKIEHLWNSSYTVDKEATCTEEGSESIHCASCEAIKEGSTRFIVKTDHTYGDWKVTKEPKTAETGVKERACTVCGFTQKESIAKLSADDQQSNSQNVDEQTPVAETTTGTPEVTLTTTDFTYKFAVKKVKVGKKKKKQAVATVQVPAVSSVKLNGKVITVADYDVSFSNAESSAPGQYKVIVTLKGKYKGIGTATYNINPKPAKISKPAKGKKKMTVKWKKAAKNDITYKALDGYEIQYSLASDFSSADIKTTTASKKAKSKTIKKLQSKQTYYVRIRTYKNASGGKVYSSWSAVKAVAVK